MPSFITFIPTPPEDIEAFFDLAPLSPSDVVYDLGSGDGRLLFAALEGGAGRAVGVELDHERVLQARLSAKNKGVEDRVTIVEGDVLEVGISDATVVFCYLVSAASAALKPKFESELKAGSRVVMETFPVPGWKAAETRAKGYRTFYLYRMPPELTDEPVPQYFYPDYWG
jgi:tRNA A58 N-methylase Trm61